MVAKILMVIFRIIFEIIVGIYEMILDSFGYIIEVFFR